MININLRNIFCHLTGNDNFLSTTVDNDIDDLIKKKKTKKKKFNLMANMVTEYEPLLPYQIQTYDMFPQSIKDLLTPDYARFGIKNHLEKDINIINISFLNSLNILLRPTLYKTTMDDQIHNFHLLENFICHKIQRNFQIDRTKNTKKVQAINKEVKKKILEGKISHELIQYIINIFEINLLVFDLTKSDVYLYWTKSTKYPYFNPFKDIYYMSYTQGNYEPIMSPNNSISEEVKRKMYTHILNNLTDIKCIPDLKLATHTLVYFNTWNMDYESYTNLLENFFNDKINVKESINFLSK